MLVRTRQPGLGQVPSAPPPVRSWSCTWLGIGCPSEKDIKAESPLETIERVPGDLAAAAYAWWKYGSIPAPGAGLPGPPAPAAPQTPEEMRNWTEEQRIARDIENWEAWKAAQRAAIEQAQKSGEYRGDTWWEKYGWWVLGAGATFVGLVALGGRR